MSTSVAPVLFVEEVQMEHLRRFLATLIFHTCSRNFALSVDASSEQVKKCLEQYFNVESVVRSDVDFNGGSQWKVRFGSNVGDLEHSMWIYR